MALRYCTSPHEHALIHHRHRESSCEHISIVLSMLPTHWFHQEPACPALQSSSPGHAGLTDGKAYCTPNANEGKTHSRATPAWQPEDGVTPLAPMDTSAPAAEPRMPRMAAACSAGGVQGQHHVRDEAWVMSHGSSKTQCSRDGGQLVLHCDAVAESVAHTNMLACKHAKGCVCSKLDPKQDCSSVVPAFWPKAFDVSLDAPDPCVGVEETFTHVPWFKAQSRPPSVQP